MEKKYRFLAVLLLLWLPGWVVAQELETGEFDPDELFVETSLDETETASLLIDNTRTKVGKDFYDLFYRFWSGPFASADTSRNRSLAGGQPIDELLITIEELPAPGSGTLMQISLDGEPVWQLVVQARLDLLEIDVAQAVETLRFFWRRDNDS